jgi:hypothetical protein
MWPPSPPLFYIPTSGPSCYDMLPVVDRPISPETQAILSFLQKELTSKCGRERPHHSTSTSDIYDLCHALADMFSLSLLPISKPAPDRSPSPMVAISKSQSCRDKSHQFSSKSTVSATYEHSPDPKESHKQPNVWDLKDLAHSLY